MQTRAAIYCRLSDDPTNGWGVADQEHHCRRLAERMGWDVVGVYADNDVGATSRIRKRRKDYERLCADIAARAIDAVVVTELSRLHRRPLEWHQLCQLGKTRRLKIKSLTAYIDLETGEGDLAEAGEGKRHNGGNRPFGYRYSNGMRIIIAEEAELIREAALRVQQNETLGGICADWQQRGVTTSRGNIWLPTTLRQTLLRRSLTGYREHAEVVAPANWDPILSEDEWERVRNVLTDPSRLNHGRVNVRAYLLTGHAFCGLCNQPLRGGPRSVITGARAYSCRRAVGYQGCGRIKRQADPLEKEVVERLLYRLNSPELRASLTTPDDNADRKDRQEIERIRAGLTQIADDYVDETFTKEEYLRQKARLQGRMEAAERRLSSRQATYMLATLADEPVREAWDSRPLDWRRALIGTVIEKVVVLPQRGRVFDPSTVKTIWKVSGPSLK